MLLYRATAYIYTVSCRRFAPGDEFIASSEDVEYLPGLVTPLTPEASLALQQVPPPAARVRARHKPPADLVKRVRLGPKVASS
jgi:hypothetical protein